MRFEVVLSSSEAIDGGRDDFVTGKESSEAEKFGTRGGGRRVTVGGEGGMAKTISCGGGEDGRVAADAGSSSVASMADDVG